MLPSYAAVTTGCREPVTRIHTEVMQAPAKMETNEQGLLTKGPVKERWLLAMCGREEAVIVTFTDIGAPTVGSVSLGADPTAIPADEASSSTIIAVAAKLSETVIQEDEKLLMYYDVALTRLGED